MAVTRSSHGSVVKLTAANDALTGPLAISKIRWVGATAAAHAAELRTGAYGADDVIYDAVASVTNFVCESVFSPPLRVRNLKLQTLGSGRVYIYLA